MSRIETFVSSGVGTNVKVGGTRPALRVGKFVGVVPLHFFGSICTINRFDECFRDGQYSFVSFLFAVLLLMVPPCPAICKSGSGADMPLCPRKSAPLFVRILSRCKSNPVDF